MRKILLVEDDQFIKDIYIEMLTPFFEVDDAEDGKTAYGKITKNSYDLILLDMYLPKMALSLIISRNLNLSDVNASLIIS